MAAPKKQIKLQRMDFQIHPAALAWLRLEAARRDCSIGALIREALLLLMKP
mgnify:CR=1 FL=1